jgi:hypothetical protein
MFFIRPMWDSETERIGKRKCTPVGSALHAIADLLGFVGLVLLVIVIGYLYYRRLTGTFRTPLLWLLAAPFGLDGIGQVLYHYSWVLARRVGFRYDPRRGEASWDEAGHRQSFQYKQQRDV